MTDPAEKRPPAVVPDLVETIPLEGAPPPSPFTSRGVEEAEELALLGSARVAPSADNAQTWRFIAVRSEEKRGALAGTVPGPLAASVSAAPLVLVVCGVPWLLKGTRREQPFVMIDVPIAVTHLLLQAGELGLACAWTLEPDEVRAREILGVPEDVRVVALLALGWC